MHPKPYAYMYAIVPGMRTTIALDAKVRDQLLARKQAWRKPSLEAVIEALLEGPPASAVALYAGRRSAVDAVIRAHSIRRLTAFGSRTRGDARPDSDLDVAGILPAKADLLDAVNVESELSTAFGLPVHFVVLGSARGRLRSTIEREGVVLHA